MDVQAWGTRYTNAVNLTSTGVCEVPDAYVSRQIPRLAEGPGLVLMDAGCGPGRYLPRMLEVIPAGGLVVAVDGVDVVIGGVEERYRNKPLLGFCHNLNAPFPPDIARYKVGGILCADVISVVDNPVALLENLLTISVNGTRVILTFQTMDDETMGDGEEIPSTLPGSRVKATTDGTTFRFFDEASTRDLLISMGFDVIDWSVFCRHEDAHIGRNYSHTHVEVGCLLAVKK